MNVIDTGYQRALFSYGTALLIRNDLLIRLGHARVDLTSTRGGGLSRDGSCKTVYNKTYLIGTFRCDADGDRDDLLPAADPPLVLHLVVLPFQPVGFVQGEWVRRGRTV
jgi:hypothetical protein